MVQANGGFWDSVNTDREYTQEDFNYVIASHYTNGVARLGTTVSAADSYKPSASGTKITVQPGLLYINGYWKADKEPTVYDIGANRYLVARLNVAGRSVGFVGAGSVDSVNDLVIYDKNTGDMRVESAPLMAVQQASVIARALYPVGSIYITTKAGNPSTYLGGEWVEWGKGKVPVGVDTADESFSTVEKTGGEKTHKLTVAEMPSHDHQRGNGNNWVKVEPSQTNGFDSSGSQRTGKTGGDQPHNNLQPFITCFMWKRTAL
jgi:hypothetical protein